MKTFGNEHRFDDLLRDSRAEADRVMVGMCVFLTGVVGVVAVLTGSWLVVPVVVLPTTIAVAWAAKHHPGSLGTRIAAGCAFMTYTAALIHQGSGATEAHFAAFGLIGVLLYYRDWRPILAATGFIYLHHLALGWHEAHNEGPVNVFDGSRGMWHTFAIHVLYFLPFIAMMMYLAVMLRRDLVATIEVIEQSRRITGGNLAERATPDPSVADHPLVEAVSRLRNRMSDLLRSMPTPILIVRADTGLVAEVNDALCRLVGLEASDCIGTDPDVWPVWNDREQWSLLLKVAGERPDDPCKCPLQVLSVDGTIRECEATTILHATAAPPMLIVLIEDVTARLETQRHMEALAYHDALTGLPNRRRLQELLAECWRHAGSGTPVAVAVIDLDEFKPVNDRLGHDAGDHVLTTVARRLEAAVPEDAVAARLGGDEFVVVLPGSDSSDSARAIAAGLVAAIEAPIEVTPGIFCRVGTTVGVAHSSEVTGGPAALLMAADRAMLGLKRSR